MEEEEEISKLDPQYSAPVLEIGDQPSREFLELFAKLDLSISGMLIERAWRQYDTVGQQVVLEGNPHVWMACAFFSSVWQATPLGQELVYKFSLSRLLDICQVNVLHFFDKLDKWADMILAPRRLLDFINRVQSNLAVAAVTFKKFLPIFRFVFAKVSNHHGQNPQSSSSHFYAAGAHFSSEDLFELIWVAFLAMRKHLGPSQEDLLNSFHLLLALIDSIYSTLDATGLQNHINVEFANSLSLDELTPLEFLCERFEGVTLDAKHLRTHWLLPRLQKLAEEGTIEGCAGATKDGILLHMQMNKKSFHDLYEQRLIVRAEVDERVFLAPSLLHIDSLFDGSLDENCIILILRQNGISDNVADVDMLLHLTTQNCLEKLAVVKAPLQPPSLNPGKSYVITPDTVCPNKSLAQEQKDSQRMDQLVREECRGIEETVLVYLFEECQQNPRDFIAEQVLSFTHKYLSKIDEELERKRSIKLDTESEEIELRERSSDVESLFYYLLQKIIIYDRERAVGMSVEMAIDLGLIFHSVDFLCSVYICALELIIFCHSQSKQFKFPWSALLFKDTIAPINFYKIIELIVRADTSLSKNMIRHLNEMEENVLEELAWSSDSPFWLVLEDCHPTDTFGGENSVIPSSQLLLLSPLYAQRQIDLPHQIIVFLKKVYQLAAIRISDLCERLRIMDEQTRQKIWTLFEHTFRMQSQLMRDHHLDQPLMCCVYIICKVCNLDITFQDIMHHYRHQPQASSRVYRQVLIEGAKVSEEGEVMEQAEYADLIKFYNCVFVGRMEDFVRLLHPSSAESKENLVPLISVPKMPVNPLSPRKLIADRINVVSMSQYAQLSSAAGRSRRYDFHRSPSKDLKIINSMVRGGGQPMAAAGYYNQSEPI